MKADRLRPKRIPVKAPNALRAFKEPLSRDATRRLAHNKCCDQRMICRSILLHQLFKCSRHLLNGVGRFKIELLRKHAVGHRLALRRKFAQVAANAIS